MNKKLLIAGGSGFIGSAMIDDAFLSDWDITILSRRAGLGRIVWNPDQGIIDFDGNLEYDAIVNLAGASITDGRWTEKKKKEIYDSRHHACNTLRKYMHDGRLRTSMYLGVSAIGIYGDRKQIEVNEETVIDHQEDWFVRTVLDWENAHKAIADLGIRTVILRIGLVLSKEGGALKKILSTPGFGVLSYFGRGNQIWPWIHIDDLTRMIFYCMSQPHLQGTFIAAAPNPVPNKDLTKTINNYLFHKRLVAGVPKFLMSILLGQMHRILFDSCNASCGKILKEGFTFRFSLIDKAMKDLLQK